MKKYSDCPQILRDFLTYHETIKGQSQKTISEYYLDLRMFLRFVKLMRSEMPIHTRLDDIPIKDVDIAFVGSITTSEIFDFLGFLFPVSRCTERMPRHFNGSDIQSLPEVVHHPPKQGHPDSDTSPHPFLFPDPA